MMISITGKKKAALLLIKKGLLNVKSANRTRTNTILLPNAKSFHDVFGYVFRRSYLRPEVCLDKLCGRAFLTNTLRSNTGVFNINRTDPLVAAINSLENQLNIIDGDHYYWEINSRNNGTSIIELKSEQSDFSVVVAIVRTSTVPVILCRDML